jgi:hypothetical protein
VDPAIPDTLFGHIPAGAFRLFCGSARAFYADLLRHLSDDLFSTGEIVSRADLAEAISAFAAARHFDQVSGPPGEDAELCDAVDPRTRAAIALRRLVATGWIAERRDHYRRTADIEPGARLLLDAMLEIQSAGPRSYGGEVLGVLTQVEAARGDPENRSEGLRNAARLSAAFLNHLRAVGCSVRAAEEAVLCQTGLTRTFDAFFDGFVGHLIGDYARLRTSSNPFRFRGRILDMVQATQFDDLLVDELGQAYVREGRADGMEAAREVVHADLARVETVFRSIDGHLELIERTAQRVETRIGNAVRFMDRVHGLGGGHLREAFAALASTGADDGNELDVSSPSSPLMLPLGGMHLHKVQARRSANAPRAVKRPVRDPEEEAWTRARAAYGLRAMPTADRFEAFLQVQMGQRREMAASEMQPTSLDDFFVFERLRWIERIGNGTLARRWQVRRVSGLANNDWLTCPDFVIARKEPIHAI